MNNKFTCNFILVLVAAVWTVSSYAADHGKAKETGMQATPRDQVVLKIAVNEKGKATLTDAKTGEITGISPYLMTTDDKGNIVVVDLEGNVLPPVADLASLGRPSIDKPVTKVENLTAISILRVSGSHYEIVCTSSGYYLRPLPH